MTVQGIKSAYRNLFHVFLNSQAGPAIFTCLFYALWIVMNAVNNADFDLHSFKERPIGSATMEGFDVGARVSLYYRCIALFFGSFFVFLLGAFLIHRKKKDLLLSAEMRIINYSSLAGILLSLLLAFDLKISESLEIIYFVHKLMLVGLLLRYLVFKKSSLNIHQYATFISLATALYFLVMDCNNLAGYADNPDFYIVTFTNCCLLLLGANFFMSRGAAKPQKLVRLSHALVPFACLPFASFLKDEVFLILKANGVQAASQTGIYLMLLVVICFVAWLRFRNNKPTNERRIIALGYFPLLIFSITAYIYYAYTSDYYDEVFETGNVYLPLMERQLFGTVPTLEKFNTHLLSDYFFSAIYSFFNGLNINELDLYDFLIGAVSYLLFYYLLYYITGNEFVALFCMVLFPYAEVLAPGNYCLGILGVLALRRVSLNPHSYRNYVLFFLTLFFLIAWRIDLAFTCAVALPMTMLFFHFRDPDFVIQWKLLIKAFLTVLTPILLLVIGLSIYRHNNFFSKLPYFLHYALSAQSYGYKSIGWSTMPEYKMQYFVFPILVGVISITLLSKAQRLKQPGGIAYLSFVFICGFYFVNFNRGIIRHSLMEWMDSFSSTFVYVILPGIVYLFFRRQPHTTKFISFFTIAVFVISTYRVPEPKGMKGTFETMIEKIKNKKNINLEKLHSRVSKGPIKIEDRYKSFIEFMDKYTDNTETYIDFSNRPMLHFYTRKETPAWFYQNPLCLRDDYLQANFVKDLANYKAPFLLFSSINEQLYDAVDQVPNTLRHYRMAEYFYNNYVPYVLIDNYSVWRRKDVQDKNRKDTIFRYRKTAPQDSATRTISAQIVPDPKKHYLITTQYSKNAETHQLNARGNGQTFSVSSVNIADSLVYSIVKEIKGPLCKLNWLNKNGGIEEITITESDYIPDFTVGKYQTYDLKRLPYIWGAYDELTPTEEVLFDARDQLNNAPKFPTIKLPLNIDKSSGNTVLISCRNAGKQPQRVNMCFGSSTASPMTTLAFDVLPSDKEQTYAIRISSWYKWYSDKNDRVVFWTDNAWDCSIKGFKITRGK